MQPLLLVMECHLVTPQRCAVLSHILMSSEPSKVVRNFVSPDGFSLNASSFHSRCARLPHLICLSDSTEVN
jgi:hypothetical protein